MKIQMTVRKSFIGKCQSRKRAANLFFTESKHMEERNTLNRSIEIISGTM